MSSHSPSLDLPLAELLRPQKLTDFVGQSSLLGKNSPLKKAFTTGQLHSMIFWGPPGVGKTTLARLLAQTGGRNFYELSATTAGKAQLQEIIAKEAKLVNSLENLLCGAPVIFLDEIHRFNKAQQDYLLPLVESGKIILIGATTENPSFTINNALLSRCRVYVFAPLGESAQAALIKKVLAWYQQKKPQLKISQSAVSWLINYAGGDARRLLNIMQQTFFATASFKLSALKDNVQHLGRYDRQGEEHYNCISAFIKSMRASDPDATLYYLARMLAAGEQAEFIARRMIIFASEDIGLAVPTAMVVANQTYQAVINVGLPEAQINLAAGALYLALCKKSRRAYEAYVAAQADVNAYPDLEIPLFLRNGVSKLMRQVGYAKGYNYYNREKKSYLPTKLKGRKYLPKS